jgi:hypothetical protein
MTIDQEEMIDSFIEGLESSRYSELRRLVVMAYNRGVGDALEEIYSTIDESRVNVEKLKI